MAMLQQSTIINNMLPKVVSVPEYMPGITKGPSGLTKGLAARGGLKPSQDSPRSGSDISGGSDTQSDRGSGLSSREGSGHSTPFGTSPVGNGSFSPQEWCLLKKLQEKQGQIEKQRVDQKVSHLLSTDLSEKNWRKYLLSKLDIGPLLKSNALSSDRGIKQLNPTKLEHYPMHSHAKEAGKAALFQYMHCGFLGENLQKMAKAKVPNASIQEMFDSEGVKADVLEFVEEIISKGKDLAESEGTPTDRQGEYIKAYKFSTMKFEELCGGAFPEHDFKGDDKKKVKSTKILYALIHLVNWLFARDDEMDSKEATDKHKNPAQKMIDINERNQKIWLGNIPEAQLKSPNEHGLFQMREIMSSIITSQDQVSKMDDHFNSMWDAFKLYFDSNVRELEQRKSAQSEDDGKISVNAYQQTRLHTSAVVVFLQLLLISKGYDIDAQQPHEFSASSAAVYTNKHVGLINDLFSFGKEEGENAPNMISVLCKQYRITQGEAVHRIIMDCNELLSDLVRECDSMFKSNNRASKNYAQWMLYLVLSNINFSIQTPRYKKCSEPIRRQIATVAAKESIAEESIAE